LKRLKVDTAPFSKPVPHLSPRRATVEDIVDEEEDSGFAPGGDADYFAEEDSEGRFFGGGLTSEQKEILNIFDKAEGVPIDEEVRKFRFLIQHLFLA
jgi:beta-catenin-like protein 1